MFKEKLKNPLIYKFFLPTPLILDLMIEISQGESKVKTSCHHPFPLSLSLFSNHSYFVTVLLALQYNCIVLFFISRHIFHTLQTDALIGLILVYRMTHNLQHLSSQVTVF